MSAIAGAGNKTTVTVTIEYGLVRLTWEAANGTTKTVTGATIEQVLDKANPGAPAEYNMKAGAVLGGILKVAGL